MAAERVDPVTSGDVRLRRLFLSQEQMALQLVEQQRWAMKELGELKAEIRLLRGELQVLESSTVREY